MQMLCSRTIPFLDSHSLSPGEAREVVSAHQSKIERRRQTMRGDIALITAHQALLKDSLDAAISADELA
jgi:hypothetical protein